MKIKRIIGTHPLKDGNVYFAEINVGFAVFFSDIDPMKLENLCNHRWNIFRSYDEEICSKIFESWKKNRI